MQENVKKSYSIFDGAIALTIATIVVKILGAIYKIPLSHFLGDEGMGYFNSAYTIYSFFYLLCTAGVPKAIMIVLNEHNDEKHQKNTLKVSIQFFSILGVIVSLLLIILSSTLSKLIGNPDASISMIAIAPSIIFASISGVYRGYLSSKVKFLNVAISQIIEGAIKLISGLIFAVTSSFYLLPLNAISAYTILGATLGSAISMIYLSICTKTNNYSEKSRQKIPNNDYKVIKSIINLSLPIAISAMVMSITNLADLSMIMNRLQASGYSKVESTSLYGNYTTYATPIFNMIVSLIAPITIAFMPNLIKEKESSKNLNNLLQSELETTCFIFIPIILGICVYSEEILIILFNNNGVYIGSKLLVYLLISVIFLIPLTIINCGLEAIGKVKAPMLSITVGSVLKIVSGYFMINNNLGILGAPVSTMISYISSLGFSIIIGYKYNIVPDIVKSVSTPLVNSFISIFTLYPIYVTLSKTHSTLISLIIASSISVTIYVFLSIIQGELVKLIRLKRLKSTI